MAGSFVDCDLEQPAIHLYLAASRAVRVQQLTRNGELVNDLLTLFLGVLLVPLLGFANVLLEVEGYVAVGLPLPQIRGVARGISDHLAAVAAINRRGVQARCGWRRACALDSPAPTQERKARTRQQGGCRSHILIPPPEPICGA